MKFSEQNPLISSAPDPAEALIHSVDLLARLSQSDLYSSDLVNMLQVTSRISQRLAELALSTLHCQRTGVVLVDPQSTQLRLMAVVGLSPAAEKVWFQQVTRLYLHDLVGEFHMLSLLEQGEAVLLDLAQRPPNLLDIRSSLVAPILVEQKLIAILFADHALQEHTYTAEEMQALKSMSRVAGLVIERDRAERAFERARNDLQTVNEQLVQAVKVQADFISIVSHEFRTTLTGIQGFSELLREQELSCAEVQEYASDIHADAQRLTHLISELLDIESMQTGKMELHPHLVDMHELIDEVVKYIRTMSTHHQFTVIYDEHLPLLSVDREKFAQALANLLSNAIKYSPGAETITISCQLEDELVHLCVQDQGVGIPAEQLEQIFTPYYRVESRKSRYIRGSGLGLAAVREIVNLHNGRIWVESSVGKGSTFHITLPFSRGI